MMEVENHLLERFDGLVDDLQDELKRGECIRMELFWRVDWRGRRRRESDGLQHPRARNTGKAKRPTKATSL
jgi:hypothetical protein